MTDTQLLTMKDFCARFGMGRTKAYELVNSGALEAVKFGPRTLVRADSAERWAASLPVFKTAPTNRQGATHARK